MKLSAKITLSVVLIVSLAVAIGGYAIVSSVFNAQLGHQITAAAEETQLMCSVLGTMAVERRTSVSAKVTEQTLEETLQIAPFRDYRLRLVHPLAAGQNLTYEIINAPEGAKDVYEVVVTCRFSVDQTTYYLESRHDVSDLYRLRGQYLVTFRLVYLAAVAFSLAAGIALGTVLTAPIRNLSRSARQIAGGNYSVRANVHTADEIGILAAQFNHMTQELESHITILGTPAPVGYCFAVKDRGRGIPPEAISRITEPFYMVDKSRARAEGGAGLGLALCKRIAELHGARLHYESIVGRGTVVSFVLREVAK